MSDVPGANWLIKFLGSPKHGTERIQIADVQLHNRLATWARHVSERLRSFFKLIPAALGDRLVTLWAGIAAFRS